MMLLNLTSPQMREALKQRVLLSAVRLLIVVVVGVELALAATLFVGNVQLKAKTSTQTQEADRSTLLLRSQGQGTVADTTKLLNSQVKALLDLQKRYVAWTPIFQAFGSLTPSGISLTGISFNQISGKATFQGTATTREAYTKYESVLQGSTLLANVAFPLQTKKTNLTFDITATFNIPR